MALWLRWMAVRADSNPRYFDLFTHALPDENQYSLFMSMVPTLSEDLGEFEFGIEPGSTRQMKDRFMIEAFDRILQMAPALQEIAATGRERLNLHVLLRPFFMALDLPINVEQIFVPMEMEPGMEPGMGREEMGRDNNEQFGGYSPEEITSLLTEAAYEGGGGDVPME